MTPFDFDPDDHWPEADGPSPAGVVFAITLLAGSVIGLLVYGLIRLAG